MKTISKKYMKEGLLLIIFLIAIPVLAMAQQQQEYEVQQGETLYAISKKLNVNISELKQWNNIEDNTIDIGQILIYFKQNDNETGTDQEPPSGSLINQPDIQENELYSVKSGDNLYTIARNHNMTVTELKAINHLESDIISIGQQLAVKKISTGSSVTLSGGESTTQGRFSLYSIKQGEDLEMVLNTFNMTESEFGELNPQINIHSLNNGQEVTVLIPPTREFTNPYLQKADLENLGTVP